MSLNSSFRYTHTALALLLSIGAVGCNKAKNMNSNSTSQAAPAPLVNPSTQNPQIALIRYEYKPTELSGFCKAALKKAQKSVDTIVAIPADKRTFDNTMLAFENAMADLSDETTPLTFMGYVSTNKTTHAEGSQCESDVGQFGPTLLANKPLYLAMKSNTSRNSDEERLAHNTLIGFEKNGMNLEDATLAKVTALQQKLADAQTQFSDNLNSDVTTVSFTADELKGVPAMIMKRFKIVDGKYVVHANEADYPAVIQNADLSSTRKALYIAYNNRAADANTKLLTDAVAYRSQIAKLLGHTTWAEYQIQGRMAPNAQTVMDFLSGLRGKLALRNKTDLDLLLKYKQSIDPSATTLDPWDVNYMAAKVKFRDYQVDNQAISEYFPSNKVMAGLFDTYSTLFNVNFVEVKNAAVWHESVKMYQIVDKESGAEIGHFYVDAEPRDGKYGHAAAFPLISGRMINGVYSKPVASIVANLTPPVDGKPSLMTHDDVVTIFHEFGHIMHQTLTKAPYASLSGSAVAQDFVEAPSQMLENYAWNDEILDKISGHYITGEKLPQALRAKMIAARNFNQGYYYTRQLLFGIYDMTIHSAGENVDVTQVYNNLFKDIAGMEPVQGTHFPASFGHLMGGYDAGYYGYLWSLVYAQDIFTRMSSDGLLNAKTGLEYRKTVLEKGNMSDATDLLRGFLKREPNSDAFYKLLGL